MKKRIGIMSALVALAVVIAAGSAFVLGHGVAHAAPTRNVKVNCGGQLPPSCYTSVSAAVAASNPGDVVNVYPGVYLETATINITVPLTLQGAGAGKTFLEGDLNDEMINVTLADKGVLTIRGLTIEGNDLPHANCGTPYVQVYSALPSDTIRIEDNSFMETEKTDPDHLTCFSEAYHNFNPLAASLLISHNQFVGFSDVAEFYDDSGPLRVDHNDSEQLNGFGAGHTAFDEFTCCSALDIAPTHVYSQNTFAGYIGTGIRIESNNASFDDLRLIANSFNLVGANPQPAVSIGGYGAGGRVRLAALSNQFTITGNAIAFQINQAVLGDIKGNLLVGDLTAGSVGLDITTGSLIPVGLSIVDNRITGFDFGLWAEPSVPAGGAAPQTITAQQNCILGNVGYGAENTSPITVQATSNWWGAASGPFDPIANPGGTGNAIFGDVIYKPFLLAAPACP